jgi:hypothetical protein
MTTETTTMNLVTADALLNNWQGHRRLTRKTIEAFPEEKLFQFRWAACGRLPRWLGSSCAWLYRS